MTLTVATFYKFVRLDDFTNLQAPLLAHCQAQGIKGTILLALEGINGTIAGSRQAMDSVLSFLRSDPRLSDLEPKESHAESFPFERMKVRLKREIVTLGIPEVDPNDCVGTYVSPQQWNQLILDPDVLVIDTRNDYEVDIGTFQGAINPQTHSFREFPEYIRDRIDPSQYKKVALFCTGGIRCEKASSFMIRQGFQKVYHLQGGILKYLETIPAEESLWKGECFVFDERIAVKHGLEAGSYDMCPSCGHPIAEADKTSPAYEEGISCPHCIDSLTPEKKARQQEKQRQLRRQKAEGRGQKERRV
jgi:UPF0176 protein